MSPTLLVWLAALGSAAALIVACASQTSDSFDDSSVDPPPSAETGSAECPADDPTQGADCTQPEGTTCAAGACGTTYFACRGGTWTSSPDAPALRCPPQAPVQDDACPRCFPTSFTCQFGCIDRSQPEVFAACAPASSGGLTWQVTAHPCPTFDASVRDAEAQDGS